METKITLAPAHLNVTPYVSALMSRDLHRAAEALVVTDRFSLTHFLLYAMSIEIGLKAAILNIDNSAAMKKRLKDEVGHNLVAANACFAEVLQVDLLTAEDVQALTKLNKFFMGKKLEYFTPDMLVAALTAFSEFPPLDAIKAISVKLDAFLTTNQHFL